MLIRTVTLVSLVLAAAVALPSKPLSDGDEAAIRDVIRKHYVEGMYIRRDPEQLREGLAPTFVFHSFWKGRFSNSNTARWFERMKLDGTPTQKRIESKVSVLDVTGVAVVARLDL